MATNTHTLLDVVNIVAFRVGDIKDRVKTLVNPDPAIDHLVYCINAAVRQMARVKGLRTEASRITFNTILPYTTGTVTVVHDDATVTGAGTTWVVAMEGRAFATDLLGTEYRIESVDSTTELTLDKPWVSVGQAGLDYTIAQDRYSLGAAFSDINYASYDGASRGDISIVSPTVFARQRHVMRSMPFVTGVPTWLSVYDKDSTDNWMVELDPFPDNVYRIELRAQDMPLKFSTDDEAVTVPIDDENIDTLIAGAVAMWKDKDQPGMFLQWVQTELPFYAAMDTKMTDERPTVIPDDPTRVQNRMGIRKLPRDLDFLSR